MKTMKFVQKMASAGCGRTGVITDIPRLPEVSIQTPALMLYTKGGSIPHITHEVLQLISRAPHLVQLPLLSTLQMRAGVSAQGGGLATFCGLAEHPSLMVLQDPTLHTPVTKLEKYVMPLWTRMGKMEIDTDMYMDIVECYKPDMYAPLCDGCTDATSSKKRLSKSMDRSATMFHRCLERHKQSHYLSKNSSILGVIEGGHSLDQRIRCLDILLENKDEIGGFILDGIETNGPSLEDREIDSIKTIVEGVTACLPQDKLRLSQGCWNAVAILDLVALGWDLFDSTLPYQATERGCGLSFSFHIDNKHSNDGNTEEKLEEENKMADPGDQRCYEIDLSESRYSEDFRPIVDGCSCLCCSKYTRAYINHLIFTKELLSSVLIMIHNLHHYMEFFKSIRENAATERLAAMRDIVHRQYSQHEEAKKLKEPKTSPAIEKPRRRRLSQEGVGENPAQVKEAA